MKLNAVDVLKSLALIHLDSGAPSTVGPGCYHLETAERTFGGRTRSYYKLAGTDLGAIEPYWDDKEADGTIRVTRIAEADDPTLDGIPLPIRSGNQLTTWQKEHLICGRIIGGKFVCERCALNHGLVYPNAIAVYPVNILPYSQDCKECGIWIFIIWQSKKGGPLALFS